MNLCPGSKRAAAVILCGLLASSCAEKKDPPTLVTVEKGPLSYRADFLGEFEARNSVPIHVPDVPNTWSLTVDEVKPDGTRVNKGDVILTFSRDALESDLVEDENKHAVAEAERRKVAQSLDRERIDLELKVKRRELELERAKLQIVKGVNFISELELKKAQLDADKAQIELDLAKKALRTFQQKRATALKVEDLKLERAERAVNERKTGLGLVEVAAPVDGVVFAPYTRLNWTRTKAVAGVVARPGDKILEIPDLTSFDVHVYVRQRDATLVNVGDEAVVVPTILPDVSLKGKVKKKDDFATTRNTRFGTETPEGNLKEYLVVIEIESAPEEIRPGNTATVEIRSELADDVLKLPVAAVTERNQKQYVTLPSGEERAIRIGRTNLTHVEVLEGLSEGDKVAVAVPTAP